MTCPDCGSKKTKVVEASYQYDSASYGQGIVTVCAECGKELEPVQPTEQWGE